MSDTSATAPTREARPSLELLDHLVQEVEKVFHGKRGVVRLALAALLARGHVLFEDVPGVGKTTLSHALAKSLGLGFRRIQFTADLLPSDVLGVSVYNPQTAAFETRPGPIFTNVVVADEINRAPPRTQSGLLEAMQEGTVTIDDQTFELPEAVPRDGDAEPARAPRHLSAAGEPARPVPHAHHDRLPGRRGRAAHPHRGRVARVGDGASEDRALARAGGTAAEPHRGGRGRSRDPRLPDEDRACDAHVPQAPHGREPEGKHRALSGPRARTR